jgi:hypothetical protein
MNANSIEWQTPPRHIMFQRDEVHVWRASLEVTESCL